MSFASRSARAEKPILFSCSSSRPIIMQILPFSTTPIHNRGDQSWALQEEGRGLKEKVTQTHKFSSLKRPLELGFCCHLQDKVKCISMYYSIEISFGVLYCRVEYSQYDSVFFVCVTWGWVNQARISPFDTVVTSQTVLLYTVPWAKNPSFCLCSFVPPL